MLTRAPSEPEREPGPDLLRRVNKMFLVVPLWPFVLFLFQERPHISLHRDEDRLISKSVAPAVCCRLSIDLKGPYTI